MWIKKVLGTDLFCEKIRFDILWFNYKCLFVFFQISKLALKRKKDKDSQNTYIIKEMVGYFPYEFHQVYVGVQPQVFSKLLLLWGYSNTNVYANGSQWYTVDPVSYVINSEAVNRSSLLVFYSVCVLRFFFSCHFYL